ncbi:MAG: hypothetical protein EBT88_11305, partial [Proteobacteria bacterium]|nr:hypothetical protein [Pseudomonadota bacterium]
MQTNTSLTSDSKISINSLELNQSSLTLGTADTELEIQGLLQLDDPNQKLIIGGANLDLKNGVSISAGEISSTGGTVSIEKSVNLSGGTISITSGTLALGGEFSKTGGNLSLVDSTLTLLSDLQWNSDSLQELSSLELNDKALILKDQASDLKINSALTLDHPDEKLFSGPADLEISGLVSISAGELSSSGGEVRFEKGLNLNGGKLNILNSIMQVGLHFRKTSGTALLNGSTFKLLSDVFLTSDSLLSFDSLELVQSSLTLETADSDIEIQAILVMDEPNQKLITGDADLGLRNGANVTAGEMTSTGGTVSLSNSATLTGGKISISSGILALGGEFTKNSGNLYINDATLSLLSDLQWTSDSLLEFSHLELNDKVLSLEDPFSDLKINNDLTIDHTNEKLISGAADLEFSGRVILNAGEFSSSGGELRFEKGINQDGGKLDISNSKLKIGSQFTKTSGSALFNETSLELRNDVSLNSDSLISIKSLALDQFILTLGSADSDLEIQDELLLDNSTQKLITGDADLDLKNGLSISEGEISSTAGTVSIGNSTNLSGGEISITSGTFALGGEFSKNGGNLLLEDTTLSLLSDLIWVSDSILEIPTLELNDLSLTLDNETSDIKINSTLTLDQSTEKLISGSADLEFSGLVSVNAGELSSSAGKLHFEQGLSQSGGALDISNSTLKLGVQFNKTSGSVQLDETGLELISDVTLISDSLLSFLNLKLKESSLTLGSEDSDLEIQDLLLLDHSSQKLITGDADLDLKNGISISAGEISSTGGSVSISNSTSLKGGAISISSGTFALGGEFTKSGGNLDLNDVTLSLLSDLQWSSDSLLDISFLALNDKALILGDQFSDLKIVNPLSLDHPNEKLISGDADLEISASVTIGDGELSSNGGEVIFEEGIHLDGGKLEILNSILKVGVHFNKTVGTVLLNGTTLGLLSDLSITSDSLLSIGSLELNESSLTLESDDTDLAIEQLLLLDDPNQKLISGTADVDLNKGVDISAGEISSASGTFSINGSSKFSGGMISLASGTFALGGDFTKNGGTLFLEDITFALLSDLQWTCNSLLEINQLELNNLALTLGSESSDLKVNNPLILDQINEKLISGAADLELNELLSISNGELSSSGGEIRLNNGLDISGGKVEFLNSSLLIG